MQKNKKQKKNSKAPTHKAVPATPLTKQERKAIEARMAKLKSSSIIGKKAEILGGLVLIGIGVQILWTHFHG